MAALAKFLHDVLTEGRIHLDGPPSDAEDAEALVVLRRAYDIAALSIAGPALPFDEAAALAAGVLLERSAWYFLNPNLLIDKPAVFDRKPPTTPEQQLSADLTLRFLPTLYRRSAALMREDLLPQALEKTLREWPLSGVLADIVEPPLTPLEFGNHAGLCFLYAERLARHERAGWFPVGRGLEYVELVWSQLGKNVSMLPARAGLTNHKDKTHE